MASSTTPPIFQDISSLRDAALKTLRSRPKAKPPPTQQSGLRPSPGYPDDNSSVASTKGAPPSPVLDYGSEDGLADAEGSTEEDEPVEGEKEEGEISEDEAPQPSKPPALPVSMDVDNEPLPGLMSSLHYNDNRSQPPPMPTTRKPSPIPPSPNVHIPSPSVRSVPSPAPFRFASSSSTVSDSRSRIPDRLPMSQRPTPPPLTSNNHVFPSSLSYSRSSGPSEAVAHNKHSGAGVPSSQMHHMDGLEANGRMATQLNPSARPFMPSRVTGPSSETVASSISPMNYARPSLKSKLI